jgi:hypothetical protein
MTDTITQGPIEWDADCEAALAEMEGSLARIKVRVANVPDHPLFDAEFFSSAEAGIASATALIHRLKLARGDYPNA